MKKIDSSIDKGQFNYSNKFKSINFQIQRISQYNAKSESLKFSLNNDLFYMIKNQNLQLEKN